MNKRILTVAIIFLSLTLGQALRAGAEASERSTAVITESFASKELRPGDTWKVYLEASDPNGEMKNIYAIVEEPGVGQYPLSIIRLGKGDRKDLSGYIYLNTGTAISTFPLYYVNLTLTVQVQDRSGQFSKPVVFQLAMNDRYSQAVPPQGVFKEHALGPIMVRLHTPGGEDGRSSP